jgi:hypothetical protein
MSFPLLFLLLLAVAVYWTWTQILPERRRASLLRPGLADGLFNGLNDQRHSKGLPILEIDDDLMMVAENKATHQVLTGNDAEGWEYPASYAGMLGRSLLIEVLVVGPATVIGDRLARQAELLDGEWIRCGIGVAEAQRNRIAVAIVLCREAWEPAVEAAHAPLFGRAVLGE